MGLFDKVKATIANATSGPSPEMLASLTPAQRAAYDAKMAQVQAVQGQAAEAKAATDAAHLERVAQRPLHGPAGEWVYGSSGTVGLTPEQIATMSPSELGASTMSTAKAQIKDLFTNSLGRTKPPIPAGSTPPAVDREEQAARERGMREAARRPYLAPNPMPVFVTRVATRGRTQIEEVTAFLNSSGLGGRPDLVYGVYRVPERISPDFADSEDRRVVEWDVLHAATTPLPPSPIPVASTFFDGQQRVVQRRVGQAAVLDEDLGVAALHAIGIGPERTLGIARHVVIRRYSQGEDGTTDLLSHVTGMHVFRPAGPTGDEMQRIQSPIEVPEHGHLGVHVEALNWGAIALAVRPQPHRRATIPSPFPYLPSTPQELICMYVEIVGLRPEDCYAVSVTENGVRAPGGEEWIARGLIEWSSFGESFPCADGKERRRVAFGWLVLLSYRDRPEYAEGRQRWQAYQADVLQASLEKDTVIRRPIEPGLTDGLPEGLRRLIAVAEKIDRVVSADAARIELNHIARYRYCSPPFD